MRNVFEEALRAVPDEFSTQAFNAEFKKAAKNAEEFDDVSMYLTRGYLLARCDQVAHQTWRKRHAEGLKEEACINYLKKRGYRIQKPHTEWVEI